jgi:hypothetical protein
MSIWRGSICLVAIAAAASCVCFGQTAQAPFSLRISIDKTSVKAGADVSITVEMTNISKQNVDCTAVMMNGTDMRYQYDVQNASGKSVKKPDEKAPGSVEICSIEPGESDSHATRISWLNDLSRPGDYVVQVSRKVSDDDKDGVVKSNKITVNIIP